MADVVSYFSGNTLSSTLSPPDTAVSDIEDSFKSFLNRPDIAVILINQNVSH